jgi:prophage antirepressor-like protein
MKNEVKLFNNEVFGNIRATVIDDKVWFVGKDVAEALGYKDAAKAIKTHCKNDGVAICPLIDSMGRQQQAKYINERNVIRLIMRSDLPQAEQFQDWVEEEIIPSVLQTGSYNAPQLTVEQKMVLDIVFPQDDVQQALAVQVYGNYKYNSGREVGYTEGHEVGYTQGHVDGYAECGRTEYITTTKVVRLINERAGGSFNGHKLTTIELFEWLEYLGYGEYKLPHEKAGKRKFFASQEFMDILLEDKLGQVNVINGRHEIKWTKEWASTVGLDNIGGWLKNRGTKSFK